jgi:hypothetical protein
MCDQMNLNVQEAEKSDEPKATNEAREEDLVKDLALAVVVSLLREKFTAQQLWHIVRNPGLLDTLKSPHG